MKVMRAWALASRTTQVVRTCSGRLLVPPGRGVIQPMARGRLWVCSVGDGCLLGVHMLAIGSPLCKLRVVSSLVR